MAASQYTKPILESNPLLAESIGELIEERRAKLLEQVSVSEDEEEGSTEKGVLRMIKSFFGLTKPKV